jgi:hypothetical protein
MIYFFGKARPFAKPHKEAGRAALFECVIPPRRANPIEQLTGLIRVTLGRICSLREGHLTERLAQRIARALSAAMMRCPELLAMKGYGAFN